MIRLSRAAPSTSEQAPAPKLMRKVLWIRKAPWKPRGQIPKGHESLRRALSRATHSPGARVDGEKQED